MRKFVLIMLAALSLAAVTVDKAEAQRIPEEDDILANILSSESPYYYPAMMIRYMAGDLTLTPDHYYYLYYGFAYDEAFDGHASLPGENTILEIFARTEHPTQEEAQEMIKAAKENMLVDPFNPGNINVMTFAYGILGDTINEIISADRFRKVIDAIESSGTGQRETSPWHVLRFTHANDLIAAKGYRIESRQVRTLTVEYIKLEKNSSGTKGYFFDFGRVYWKPYDGERVKRQSKWMLNDIPL